MTQESKLTSDTAQTRIRTGKQEGKLKYKYDGTFTLHIHERYWHQYRDHMECVVDLPYRKLTLVRDKGRDQEPLFPIVPVPFPVLVLVPYPYSRVFS